MILLRWLPLLAAILPTQQVTAEINASASADVGAPGSTEFSTLDLPSRNSSMTGVVRVKAPSEDALPMGILRDREYIVKWDYGRDENAEAIWTPPTQCCKGQDCTPASSVEWTDQPSFKMSSGAPDEENLVAGLIRQTPEWQGIGYGIETVLSKAEGDGEKCPTRQYLPILGSGGSPISCTRRKFVAYIRMNHWVVYSRFPGYKWGDVPTYLVTTYQPKYDSERGTVTGRWTCERCDENDTPTGTCPEDKPEVASSSPSPITSEAPSSTTSSSAPAATTANEAIPLFWRDGINGEPRPEDLIQENCPNCWHVAPTQMLAKSVRGKELIKSVFQYIPSARPDTVYFKLRVGGRDRVRYEDVKGTYEATPGAGWWVGAFQDYVSRRTQAPGDRTSADFLRMFFDIGVQEEYFHRVWWPTGSAEEESSKLDRFSPMLKRAGIGPDDLFTTITVLGDVSEPALQHVFGDTTITNTMNHAYWIERDGRSTDTNPRVIVHNPHEDGLDKGVSVEIYRLRWIVSKITQEPDSLRCQDPSGRRRAEDTSCPVSSTSDSSTTSSTESPTSPISSSMPTARPDGSECVPPSCFPGLCVPPACTPIVVAGGAVVVPLAVCTSNPALCAAAVIAVIADQDYVRPQGFDFTYTGPTPTGTDTIALGPTQDSTPATTNAGSTPDDGRATPAPGPTSSVLRTTSSETVLTSSLPSDSAAGSASQTPTIGSATATGTPLSNVTTLAANATVAPPASEISPASGNITTEVSATEAPVIPTNATADSAAPASITDSGSGSVEPTGEDQPPTESGLTVVPPPVGTDSPSGESTGSRSPLSQSTHTTANLEPNATVTAPSTGGSTGDEATPSTRDPGSATTVSSLTGPVGVQPPSNGTQSFTLDTQVSQTWSDVVSATPTASSTSADLGEPESQGSGHPTGFDSGDGQPSGTNTPFNVTDGTLESKLTASVVSTTVEVDGSAPSPSGTQQDISSTATGTALDEPPATEDWAEQTSTTSWATFEPTSTGLETSTSDGQFGAQESWSQSAEPTSTDWDTQETWDQSAEPTSTELSTQESWDQSADPTSTGSHANENSASTSTSEQASPTWSTGVDGDDGMSSVSSEWDSESASTTEDSWMDSTTEWWQSTESFTSTSTSESASIVSANSSQSVLPTPPADAQFMIIAARPNATTSELGSDSGSTTATTIATPSWVASTSAIAPKGSAGSGAQGVSDGAGTPTQTPKGSCLRRRGRRRLTIV